MIPKSSRAWLLFSSLLFFSTTTSSFAWQKILPHHFNRYPVSPSVYGYPLDDMSPGYYGGARYKEYYAYGRGYALADFPGPVPEFGHGPWFRYKYWPFDSTKLPTVHQSGHSPYSAFIIVNVPPDAQVWLEGQPTHQIGTTRTFVSPILPPNQTFQYQVRVRWTSEKGVTEQTQNVEVQAGQEVVVQFPLSNQTQPVAAMPTIYPTPK